jgi:replication-associated recombination protein RarA
MNRKEIVDDIWQEKYRGKSISDIIMPVGLKRYFNKMIEDKDIPHLLFFSSFPGTGKSTTAKALCRDIGSDYIFINASKDGNIDTIRTTVENYASVQSFNGSKKVVILDELDGASPKFYDSLRGFTEEYSKFCRFICTLNHITKIPEPLQSRFEIVDFNFSTKKDRDDMIPRLSKRMKLILNHEKISFEDNVIDEFVSKCFPDIRKVLKTLSQEAKTKGVISSEILSIGKGHDELYNLLLARKFTECRKFVIENVVHPDEIYTLLFKEFVPKLPTGLQWDFIIKINEYQYMNAMVPDKELCLAACMAEIISKLSRTK